MARQFSDLSALLQSFQSSVRGLWSEGGLSSDPASSLKLSLVVDVFPFYSFNGILVGLVGVRGLDTFVPSALQNWETFSPPFGDCLHHPLPATKETLQ